MEEIIIDPIKWSAPEYAHKERSVDWFWTIGLITIIGAGIALWMSDYLFGFFILTAGASLILFNYREPHEIEFKIETNGMTINNVKYQWKELKGFNIKNKDEEEYDKLLIETSKKFIPIFTILLPKESTDEVKEALTKIIPRLDLEESQSVQFLDKIGL